jgi:hypothetical protein
MSFGYVHPMDDACASRMHELLVVVQIEAVEIGTLTAFDLLDSQDLPLQELNRFAGAGFHSEFIDDAARIHDSPNPCPTEAVPAGAWLQTRATRGG